MTLEELTPLIKKDLQSAEAAKLPHYREMGALLKEAECQFDDFGKWEAWLRKHFNLDHKTAWKYMRLVHEIQFIAPTRERKTRG